MEDNAIEMEEMEENQQEREIKNEKDLEKIRIGEMCRIILNVARAVWLKKQEHIKEVGFIKYCQKETTLENVLLWAKTNYH